MDKTFQQLGQLLLDGIPTIVLFVLLHFYLKWSLYTPLQRTLRERSERIEGRRASARQVLEAAGQKLAGYEESLRHRRQENYKLIEGRRQEGTALRQKHVAEARQQAAQAMVAARQQLAEQSSQAHAQLRATAEALAGQIVTQVLRADPAAANNSGVGA